jgi:hypothetical protein
MLSKHLWARLRVRLYTRVGSILTYDCKTSPNRITLVYISKSYTVLPANNVNLFGWFRVRQEHTQYGIYINSETSSYIRPGKNNLLEKNALAYLATALIIEKQEVYNIET